MRARVRVWVRVRVRVRVRARARVRVRVGAPVCGIFFIFISNLVVRALIVQSRASTVKPFKITVVVWSAIILLLRLTIHKTEILVMC